MNDFYVGRQEALEIIVSILTIALVFTFYDSGLSISPSVFIFSMAAAIVTLGSGFVLHELAHKYFAIRYGARAAFKAWPLGLALALGLVIVPQILGWLPIFFIAPGAVYIYSMRRITAKENGIISLAGPATNWVVGIIFLALAAIFSSNQIIHVVSMLGFRINFSLALFNLLPIYPLDGSKVLHWDVKVWLVSVLISFGGLAFLPGLLR
ncbi:MAG: hypothetical protein QXN37_00390 [Candidatus Anstonellaceae archaeon]